MDWLEAGFALVALMGAQRTCVCHRALHNYTVMPGDDNRNPRMQPRACCRCPEDCLCHGGGPRK